MVEVMVVICSALGSLLTSGQGLPAWQAIQQVLKAQSDQQNTDWVAYYKNDNYQRIQFGAPVFVSPTMQWAVPNSCLNGPPCGPPGSQTWMINSSPYPTAGQPQVPAPTAPKQD